MAGLDNNTILYLRGDSFTDISLNPKTLTQGSNISIVDNKINMNNPTKGLILSTTETLGGDFTFEWWANIKSTTNLNTFVNRGTPGFFLVGHWADSKSSVSNWVGTGIGSTTWDVISGQFLDNSNINKDTHYAFVRKGNTYYSFKDGKLISQQDASVVSLGLNNSSIGDTSSQSLWNIRISNVARWTEEFIPPLNPYNSIQINIKHQDKTKIDFNVTKLGNENISKVEILLNGVVSNTYKNIGDLTYNIDNSLYRLGENKINIRVTYDNQYIEEETLIFIYGENELLNSSSLEDVIERYDLINNTLKIEISNLKNSLAKKGVECSDSNKITDLIGKIENIPLGKKWGSGTCNTQLQYNSATTSIPLNLDFIPSIIYIECESFLANYNNVVTSSLNKIIISNNGNYTFNMKASNTSYYSGSIAITELTSNKVTIKMLDFVFNQFQVTAKKWIAFE